MKKIINKCKCGHALPCYTTFCICKKDCLSTRRKIKQHIQLDIEVEYATDFQREVNVKSMKAFIQVWLSHVKMSHKKNKIKINKLDL